MHLQKWNRNYIYNFDLSEQEGCNIARKIGIQEYIKNNFANIVDDLEIMVCKEEKGSDNQEIAIKKKDDQHKSKQASDDKGRSQKTRVESERPMYHHRNQKVR